MGPLARYQSEIDQGTLDPDPEQAAIMSKLDTMARELSRRSTWTPPSQSPFARWFKPRDSAVPGVQGLYLWGGVGRGKTHLCDLFFDSLDFEDKTRLHFHRFMQRIHDDLRAAGEIENPMEHIADDWAARSRLLLLDEIHVHDITDAMLLGSLLGALFKRGVTLVTTSNIAPDDLYKEGLQRARFLPAIAQIKANTAVVQMLGATDYRLRLLQVESIYLVSDFTDGRATQKVESALQAHFDRLKTAEVPSTESLLVNDRELPVIARDNDLVWFSFDALCNTPRSSNDYIELGSLFHTVMLSDVPIMNEMRNDEARRFVNLVDEFYDRGVNLIMSAEAEPKELYVGNRLSFEFERAASRLIEMQTSEYLAATRRNVSKDG